MYLIVIYWVSSILLNVVDEIYCKILKIKHEEQYSFMISLIPIMNTITFFYTTYCLLNYLLKINLSKFCDFLFKHNQHRIIRILIYIFPKLKK